MLANRLSVLLAERQISIKEVVAETGLSRSAISNIVNNPDANVATATIDLLCLYLGVTPAEFFTYWPYSVRMQLKDEMINVGFGNSTGERNYFFPISIMDEKSTFGILMDDAPFDEHTVYILADEQNDGSGKKEFANHIKDIPAGFMKQLEKKYISCIQKFIDTQHEKLRKIIDEAGENEADEFDVYLILPWENISRTMVTKTLKFA